MVTLMAIWTTKSWRFSEGPLSSALTPANLVFIQFSRHPIEKSFIEFIGIRLRLLCTVDTSSYERSQRIMCFCEKCENLRQYSVSILHLEIFTKFEVDFWTPALIDGRTGGLKMENLLKYLNKQITLFSISHTH